MNTIQRLKILRMAKTTRQFVLTAKTIAMIIAFNFVINRKQQTQILGLQH